MLHQTRSIALPLTLLLAAACSDEPPLGPQVPVLAALAELPADSVRDDPHFIELSRDFPGFGGFFFNTDGNVVVLLVNTAAAEDIRPRIGALVEGRVGVRGPDHMGKTFIFRRADYPFLELALYRTRLRGEIFSISGVVTLGVDEARNRVKVGIAEPTAENKVELLLGQLHIPREAVIFEQTEYAMPFSHDLRDRFSLYTSGLQGGWEISPGCTIGFPAIWEGSSVFVTNSHCTDAMYSYDGGSFFQPNSLSYPRIGYERHDPPSYTCGWIPDPCRNSDAAVIAAEVPIELAKIARTTYWAGDGSSGSIIIDHDRPTFTITSRNNNNMQGEYLDKVGRTTGWTYGDVLDTCDDVELSDGYVRECADKVDAAGDEGDSGSPVFLWNFDHSVELRGVLFGGVPYDFIWMSDLRQIELDLGPLTVL